MSLEAEKEAMNGLMALLSDELSFSESKFWVLSKNNSFAEIDSEFEKRITFIRYGFEVRTKSVLENIFPHTKCLMAPEEWLNLGYNYCKNEAIKFVNINEIGEHFPKYLQTNSSNQLIIESAHFELLLYFSAKSGLGHHLTYASFDQLKDDSHIKLCDHVKIHSGLLEMNTHPWTISHAERTHLIFRTGQKVKSIPLEESLANVYKKLSIVSDISEIPDERINESDLIEFLQHALKYEILEVVS